VIKKILALIFSISILSGCHTESYIRSRVVKLTGNHHSCSGTQVHSNKGQDYILTAGHCGVLAENGMIYAQLDNERPIARRIIEESPDTDLLLLEGMPNLKGLDIAKTLERGDSLRAFTHGEGMATYKTSGTYIDNRKDFIPISAINSPEQEEACTSKPKFAIREIQVFIFVFKVCGLLIEDIVTDLSSIAPGSSGGLVADNSGDLCGVVFAGDEKFALIVPLKDIRNFLQSY
jgi:hypothetical protein